ncbi:MAG: ISNCY family transposase, partial [Terriglobales bacterium]
MAQLKRKALRLKEAAELLGISYRQGKRLKARYWAAGARGLVHGNAGKRSHRARPEAERERVLALVRERYGGGRGGRFGPTLAVEHLAQDYGLEVGRETLWRWMLAEGLWSRSRRRQAHRQRRERKAHFGELVQMDGSFHAWLEERGAEACLLDLVDDASGRADGHFTAQETIWAAADALRGWVEKYGIPLALYTDHKNLYVRPPSLAEQLRGEGALTQFGRMCERLGTRIIAAGSPQAKGRIERGHGTHQDRLVKKMRLRGIADYAAANAYLEQYWAEHNRRFGRAPRSAVDYHRQVPRGMDLDRVFSLQAERKLSQDWVVSYAGQLLQVEPGQRVRPRQPVTVEEQRTGKLRLLAGGRELRWHPIASLPPRPQPRRRQPPAARAHR